jgi:4-amino-4-deoxy-L-arabinose transferase-like glycosyltransferase
MAFFRKLPAGSWIPLAVAAILLLSSAFVGLTDDEAYYWVLAQKPALGYAYHPPMVAWVIALSQVLFGRIFGTASTWVVRIPSCFTIGLVFYIALKWVNPSRENYLKPTLILASFAGLVGLGWMMVPDEPLFLGWMICFYACHKIARDEVKEKYFWFLGLGIFIAMLSKFSGVFVYFSAIVSVALCGGRSRLLKTIFYASLAMVLAMIPICIWNSQHEWSAILYQIKERHANSDLSFKRYLRFWLIELFAAGPVLVFFTLKDFFRGLQFKSSLVDRFVAIWILPAAAVYCVQPLFSDFKPHWAFIVWWPGALLLALKVSQGKVRFATAQICYGLTIVVIVLFSLNVPVLGALINRFGHFNSDQDPRLFDVTNDLYGWRKLGTEISRLPKEDQELVVVGSRYQTASQAAFALGGLDRATLLPRDLRSRDEWPDLQISEKLGPEWPKLLKPILFVTDNRFDAAPEFPQAKCMRIHEVSDERWGMSAKSIWIWKCTNE